MKNVRTIVAISCTVLLLVDIVGVNAMGDDPVRGHCVYGGPPVPYEFDYGVMKRVGNIYPDDSIISDSESNYDVVLETDMSQLKLGGQKQWYLNGDLIKVEDEEVYGRKVCQTVSCK